jgi:putative oxidoreductase
MDTLLNRFDDGDFAPYGATLLRLSLGAMWLAHGVFKLTVFGVAGLAGWLPTIGFPAWTAAPLIGAEIAAGALILLGIHGRLVSLAMIPVMLGATWVHLGNGWVFSNTGGGWEYPVFLIVASLVHATLGDGKFAVRSHLTK